MHKLIPSIYFYLLSLVGMVLLIIGLFSATHYIVGTTVYEKYPLPYGNESRCEAQVEPYGGKSLGQIKNECMKDLDNERVRTKTSDLERAISFSIIGLVVFSIHFYFARKLKKD